MLRFMFFWDVGGDGGALRAHIVEKENTPKFHCGKDGVPMQEVKEIQDEKMLRFMFFLDVGGDGRWR